MSQSVVMRTGAQRVKYTVVFELVLMSLLVPAGAVFFDKSLSEVGVLGLILTLKAMVLGLAYNWLFDAIDAKSGRIASDRSAIGRILHACGFEISLMLTSLPIYMWWLGLGLLQAVTTGVVVTSFVVFYTFLFTLVYDRLFPVRPR
ncbi:PACE efflux transporter [Sulfitobacter sp.]|uniref:PACE efflux transporter n=1 Tax=Sulfitobacter sp. TaxID=1903071 RepID=UPI0039E49398